MKALLAGKASLIILLLHLLFGFNLVFPKIVSATVLTENFNDGNTDGWVVVNEPGRTPCSAPWIVENGELLIEINQGSCTKHLVPTDILWNNLGDEYEIEVDMRSGGGTDHNIAFRFNIIPPNINEWYDYHFSFPNNITLERVPTGTTSDSVRYNFSHNVTYHLKILVKTGNIKLSINDEVVQDYHYDPSQERFPSGKFAFRAGTGSDPYSKTYFDNLTVKSIDELNPSPSPIPPSPSPTPSPLPSPSPSVLPSPSSNNPIVFLPGFGGSWSTGDMITRGNIGIWKKTPFVKVYDNLINTFLSADSPADEDVFVFYYDWRQPVTRIAAKLNEFINQTVMNGKDPGTKINLVGHSLGGLVVRTYAQNYGLGKINQVVTAGSPHEGAIPAYLAWSGTQIKEGNNWESLVLGLYLHLHQGRFDSPVDAVQTLAPSLKDLLPIFNFAKNSTGQIIPVTTFHSVNDFLVDLKTDVTPGLTDLLTTVAGDHQPTLTWIKLGGRNLTDRLLNRWPDGRPTDYESTDAGDGTVLTKSALVNDADQETIANTHQDLVQTPEGIDAILSALNLDATPQTGNEQPNRNPGLFFFLHSPAELTVTAPDGNQAGYGVTNPMANSIYSPEDKLLLIHDALAGEYQLTITGTGNGEYQLDIGQLTDNGDDWTALVDTIQTNATDTWTINFQPQNPLADPVLDPTGTIKIDQALLRLKNLINFINVQNWKRTVKKDLTGYLNRLIQLLDKDKNNQALRLALTSIYKFRYWSDHFKVNEPYLINEANQIGELINQSLVTNGKNTQPILNQKQTWALLRNAEWEKEKVEQRAGKISGANLPLGRTLELMNYYFDRAQTAFEDNNFWQTQADALVIRMLAIEANALIK